MAIVTANTLSGIVPVRAGGSALLPPPGNIAAPAIVTPPAGLLFDYMDTDKAEWQMSNNQFDTFTTARDWNATINNPQSRVGGFRSQPTWITQLFNNVEVDGQWITTTAFPYWQPAFRRVWRVYRKGSSGQGLRTLVFECEHNSATVPVGDTVWCYMGSTFHGGGDPDTSLNLSGFNLPLKTKMTCSGGQGATENPLDSRSTIEVTFGQDLPAVDYTSPTMQIADWSPPEPRLHIVHHSFYANSATRTLRHPIQWYRDTALNNVLPNGGHMIIGGLQGIPTWRDWTQSANFIDQTLMFELYKMEQEGLAAEYGHTDPQKLANELENEPTEAWTRTDGKLGFRDALVDIMYPVSRSAWGAERTIIIKGTGFGGLDSLISSWNLTNDSHFGGGNNHLANHNYVDQAHVNGEDGGRQLWYDDASDCQFHVQVLLDKITQGGFKGGGMTEWGVYNSYETALRGRMYGKLQTYLYRKGLYCALWDIGGDSNAASWFYDDVPGAIGKTVQAIFPELRPYMGKAERSA